MRNKGRLAWSRKVKPVSTIYLCFLFETLFCSVVLGHETCLTMPQFSKYVMKSVLMNSPLASHWNILISLGNYFPPFYGVLKRLQKKQISFLVDKGKYILCVIYKNYIISHMLGGFNRCRTPEFTKKFNKRFLLNFIFKPKVLQLFLN